MRRPFIILLAMAWLASGIQPETAGQTATIPATGTVAEKTVAGPGLVSDIQVKPAASGATTIDVVTTDSASFHVFRLSNPARLVLDINNVKNAVRSKSIPVSSPVVKDVRVDQFQNNPDVVRVVADLSGNPLFDAHAYAGGVRIEVKPRPEPAARTTASVLAPGFSPPLASLKGGATPAPAAAPSPTSGSGQADNGGAKPPQAPAPAILRAEKAAQVLSTGENSNPSAAQRAVPPGSAQRSEENPVYTGEPISLNLKDVDLKDFFRLIHEISGLNILVDPNVTGSVTTVLDNVPWDQALDIVLKDNGLGRSWKGTFCASPGLIP